MKKHNRVYLLIFLFFLIIFILSPISGDDWGNYLVGKTGLYHSIGNAVSMYFDWEGRFISRILINILTYNKWLWNIVNSVVITSIIYFIEKIIRPKNKILIILICFLMFTFMNLYTFSQTITWLAGNITYLFVIPLMLMYFYYLIYDKRISKFINILFIILNLIMTMYVEHMALVLITGNLLLLIKKYIRDKKLDKRLLLYLIISIIGTLIMFLSPGSRTRSGMENTLFNSLSLFGKISYNIPNFIYYTFIVNSYMLVLLSISNFYVIKNKIKNRYLKIFFIIFILIIPLITTVSYPLSNITSLNLLKEFVNPNSIFITIYWVIYLFILLIFTFISENKDKYNISTFFLLLGYCSNTVMLLSPTWGYRTSFFTYISISISSLIIINKYFKFNKISINILRVLSILSVIFYLVLYISVYRCQNNVKLSIKNGIKNKSSVIEIDSFPHYINCNINPENDYHLGRFKEYYNISEDVSIKLISGKWKYLVIYQH